MKTITLKVNEHSKIGKIILDLIKVGVEEKKGVEIISQPNSETIQAIEAAEKGKIYKVKNSDQLFKELGI